MLDLDPDVVSQFSVQESISAEELTKVVCRAFILRLGSIFFECVFLPFDVQSVGISALFPESLLDSYIFDPCGYSLNGIIGV